MVYVAFGLLIALYVMIHTLLVCFVIYNAKKYQKKKEIMSISLIVMTVLETILIFGVSSFINDTLETGRTVLTYNIGSKILLAVLMTFLFIMICFIFIFFIFGIFWKKEHPNFAVVRLKGHKETGSIIEVTHVDGIQINSSKEFFPLLFRKILITEGEHELALQEVVRSTKSFRDFVIFDQKVRRQWVAKEYLITVTSSPKRCFEVVDKKDK